MQVEEKTNKKKNKWFEKSFTIYLPLDVFILVIFPKKHPVFSLKIKKALYH